MCAAETRAVMEPLTSEGGAARFVGGAVRNALLGRKVEDVDIATPLLPAEVIRRLEAARIKAIPTGIEHGTVTAVANGRPFEITTLRRDVETDGRRAVVAFSEDWAEDAGRRDFTINALYASQDGEIFDYFEGLADLETRRIRFIGDAIARIREDYLRILRLFRFHAWYGRDPMDDQARAAARQERAGLDKLSGERLQKETLRLLEAENPVPALRAMADDGILAHVIPSGSGEIQWDRIERLTAIERNNGFAADPVLRLAALMPSDASLAAAIAERLRFSNENRDRLVDLVGASDEITSSAPPVRVRRLLYRLGKARMRDRILLGWAKCADDPPDANWRSLVDSASAWVKPVFPLTGRDILAAGVAEGPQVGILFSKLEDAWIESDFGQDRPSLLERLKSLTQSSAH